MVCKILIRQRSSTKVRQTKDFIKFLSVVIILYIGKRSSAWLRLLQADAGNLGFLTTFTLLARDHFTLNEVSWVLIKVFFG